MGTEGVYVPLILSAVAAAGNAYNQHNLAQRQANIEDRRNRSAQRSQHAIDQSLNDQLKELKGSTGDKERQQALEGFLGQLKANETAQSGGSTPMDASARYTASDRAAKAGVKNYGAQRADLLSRIVGPQYQRTNEARSAARTAGDVATEAQILRMRDQMFQAQAARQRLNPWISAGSDLVGALGGAMGAGGGGPSSDEIFNSVSGYGKDAANLTPIKVSASRLTGPFS